MRASAPALRARPATLGSRLTLRAYPQRTCSCCAFRVTASWRTVTTAPLKLFPVVLIAALEKASRRPAPRRQQPQPARRRWHSHQAAGRPLPRPQLQHQPPLRPPARCRGRQRPRRCPAAPTLATTSVVAQSTLLSWPKPSTAPLRSLDRGAPPPPAGVRRTCPAPRVPGSPSRLRRRRRPRLSPAQPLSPRRAPTRAPTRAPARRSLAPRRRRCWGTPALWLRRRIGTT